MLIVLDTNVLLSALRTNSTPPAVILDAWRAGRFRLATSSEQIREFKRAAGYQKLREILPRHAVGQLVNRLRGADLVLSRLRRAGGSPDPGDEFLIAMALAADADFLVTGDRAVLQVGRVAVTRIVTPRRFVALLDR